MIKSVEPGSSPLKKQRGDVGSFWHSSAMSFRDSTNEASPSMSPVFLLVRLKTPGRVRARVTVKITINFMIEIRVMNT